MNAASVIALSAVGLTVAIAVVAGAWKLASKMAELMVEIQKLRTRILKLELTLTQRIRDEVTKHVRDRHPSSGLPRASSDSG